MKAHKERNCFVQRILILPEGILIGNPIMHTFSFEIEVHWLVAQAVEAFRFLSYFAHFDNIASVVVAKLPVKAAIILIDQIALLIVYRFSQVLLTNIQHQLGCLDLVIIFFF